MKRKENSVVKRVYRWIFSCCGMCASSDEDTTFFYREYPYPQELLSPHVAPKRQHFGIDMHFTKSNQSELKEGKSLESEYVSKETDALIPSNRDKRMPYRLHSRSLIITASPVAEWNEEIPSRDRSSSLELDLYGSIRCSCGNMVPIFEENDIVAWCSDCDDILCVKCRAALDTFEDHVCSFDSKGPPAA